MGFIGFLYLLIIAVVVALVFFSLEKLPKARIKLPGGVVTGIIIGYIGARVGVLLFGNWPFLTYQGINILPAILGAVTVILLAMACVECCKK